MTRNAWKSIVKDHVRHEAFKSLLNEKIKLKKLLMLEYSYNEWKRSKYFEVLDANLARIVFCTRTFMLPIKGNFRSDRVYTECNLCQNFNDTQEHFFACTFYKKVIDMNEFFSVKVASNLVTEIEKRLEVKNGSGSPLAPIP